MPSEFENLDAQIAETVTSKLGTKVDWLPMRQRSGGAYTGTALEPDPNRVGREGLDAIVTWRPDVIIAGEKPDQGGVEAFEVVVDVEAAAFRRAGQPGIYDLPRAPDRFVLSEGLEGNTTIEIERDGYDGSSRVLYYCNSVSD